MAGAVDVTKLSDAELEELIAQGNTPPPHDALPEAMKAGRGNDTVVKNASTGNPVIDAAIGGGEHLANSAMSIGELLRSLPEDGAGLRPLGDAIASKVFGLSGEGMTESDDISDRIASDRSVLHTAPDNRAASIGAGTMAVTEAMAPALATGGTSVIPSVMGRAGAEAALSGGITSMQEGDVDGTSALSAALSGSMPLLGRAAAAVGNTVSHHLADTLVPTGSEAVKRGGDAARGLQDSGVMAGGAKSLMTKLQTYVSKSTDALDSFIASHPKGNTPLIDRNLLLEPINDAIASIKGNVGATSDAFGGASAGEKKAIVQKLIALKNSIAAGATPEGGVTRKTAKYVGDKLTPNDALKFRRDIDKMTGFGAKAQKTTASEALNEVRQKVRSVLNEQLDLYIPESGPMRKKVYDGMLALEGAERLVDQPGLGKESFLVRRALPLALSAGTGGLGGFVASGGSPVGALAGLGAGAAMGLPAAATPLIQLLKTSEGGRAAEIAARIFGLLPGALDDDQQQQEQERKR